MPGPTAPPTSTDQAGAGSLRIAMVAPPYFSVPPRAYGGIESVVADLVDALVDRRHRVTLVAAGPAGTRAQQYLPACDALASENLGEPLPELLHAARVGALLEDLDIDLVHDHTLAGPLLARGRPAPTVATVHSPVVGALGAYYRALDGQVSLVSISGAQRAAAPDLMWVGTVHNSVRVETFTYRAHKEPFVLFLGRFHPHKAPHLAIDAARACRLPIVLAGKCTESMEHRYFAREVGPRLGPDVTVVGVADAAVKRELLGRASCLVFPITWDEPFGLVMIEAMASGTPVAALRRGAVPEIVVDGVTGVVVEQVAELPGAILGARRLRALDCRAHVEGSFSTEAMACGYETAYRKVLGVARSAALDAAS
jgi:glycosyltransferase involved in cell wall biosynthesis